MLNHTFSYLWFDRYLACLRDGKAISPWRDGFKPNDLLQLAGAALLSYVRLLDKAPEARGRHLEYHEAKMVDAWKDALAACQFMIYLSDAKHDLPNGAWDLVEFIVESTENEDGLSELLTYTTYPEFGRRIQLTISGEIRRRVDRDNRDQVD